MYTTINAVNTRTDYFDLNNKPTQTLSNGCYLEVNYCFEIIISSKKKVKMYNSVLTLQIQSDRFCSHRSVDKHANVADSEVKHTLPVTVHAKLNNCI